MANEIAFNFTFSCNNGKYSEQWNRSDSYGQTQQGAAAGIAAATVTPSDLDYGNSVGTLGYLLMQNLDSVNSVYVGLVVSGSFTPFAGLNAGEECVFRVYPGIQIQLQSSAGTVFVNYWLLEN